MFFGTLAMVILYIILRYILAWITYFNNLDPSSETLHGVGVMIIM